MCATLCMRALVMRRMADEERREKVIWKDEKRNESRETRRNNDSEKQEGKNSRVCENKNAEEIEW